MICVHGNRELFRLSKWEDVMCSSGHMTSILLSILERDPPLLLSWRVLPLCEHFCSSIFWEFFLIRCEVKGQGCRTCTDCKALWGHFFICDIGLYKINWIELNWQRDSRITREHVCELTFSCWSTYNSTGAHKRASPATPPVPTRGRHLQLHRCPQEGVTCNLEDDSSDAMSFCVVFISL